MTRMRSATAKTSARRCETKMQATPRSRRVRIRAKRRCASGSVSAAVGSSRISSRACLDSARAITTSCCVARSSVPIRAPGSTSTAKSRSTSPARTWSSSRSTNPNRVGSLLRNMFSATVRSGTTLTSCGISTTPAASAAATFAGANGRPSICDRAVVRSVWVDAGQNLDHRRLAGAVLPQQRHDLARVDDEIDRIHRQHTGKSLRQPLSDQQWFFHRCHGQRRATLRAQGRSSRKVRGSVTGCPINRPVSGRARWRRPRRSAATTGARRRSRRSRPW